VSTARRPRVVLDVTAAVRQSAGIGRFVREQARALLARDRFDYRLLVAGRRGAEPALLAELLADVPRAPQIIALPFADPFWTRLWHRAGLPLPARALTGAADVFHATDFLAPPGTPGRLVVTVHDLSFLAHPELAHPALARFLAASVPRSVRRAAHVLADSAHARGEVVARLGVDGARVSVAYGGVDAGLAARAAAADRNAVRARLGLSQPYVLGVGTLEPRKDWPTLMEAFARAAQGPLAGHVLAIAGGRGWRDAPILAAAAGYGARVRLLGHVPDDALPGLYAAADAFALASRYEGFGLPPLEAMACGVPTAVARAASLPEVVGDAALTVPPGDVAAWADTLVRLVTDAPLRARLAAAGPARAAQFTWQRCAEATEAGYRAALGTGLLGRS